MSRGSSQSSVPLHGREGKTPQASLPSDRGNSSLVRAQRSGLRRPGSRGAAQARACAQEAVIDFASFDALTPDNKQAFALSTTACVTLIDSLLITVTDKAAADQLGFAIDSIGPIALIVRSRAGLGNTGLVPVLVHSNQTIVTVLTPTCTSRIIEDRTQWTCRVYGNHVDGPEPSLTLAQRLA